MLLVLALLWACAIAALTGHITTTIVLGLLTLAATLAWIREVNRP